MYGDAHAENEAYGWRGRISRKVRMQQKKKTKGKLH